MSDQKSFTVIELLVVIAVIGVLASIILVSLSSTRDRAQITKTLLYSNQIYHTLGADIVGNWNFDEGSGNKANDSSGYYNTCTIYGGATYTTDTPQKAAGQGQGKYALSFNGTDGYVDCGDPVNGMLDFGTNDFTVSTWIKFPLSGSYVWNGIVQKGYTVAAPAHTWGIVTGNPVNNLSYQDTRNSGGNWNMNYYKPGISDGWHHFVVTRSSGITYRFYIDGNLDTSSTSPEIADLSNSNSLIFGRNSNGDRYFSSFIDEVQIYSRALTAAEIQQDYAEGVKTRLNLALK